MNIYNVYDVAINNNMITEQKSSKYFFQKEDGSIVETFKNMSKDELFKIQLNTKKNIKKFSQFQHYKTLDNILN